ncbi:MAG: hypothetical protein V1743_01500 [Nanoarchaeota archaeon]
MNRYWKGKFISITLYALILLYIADPIMPVRTAMLAFTLGFLIILSFFIYKLVMKKVVEPMYAPPSEYDDSTELREILFGK